METYVAIAFIFLIVGLAAWYVVKEKKKGKKCIGCPDGCCGTQKQDASCSGECVCCGCRSFSTPQPGEDPE